MEKSIAVVRIKLRHAYFPIRRRVELDSNTTLDEFHEIIQTVMGWENCHLYGFTADGVIYTPEIEEEYEIPEELVDYVTPEKPTKTTKLKDMLNSKKIIYEYDFGDSWKHEIVLNRYIEAKKGVRYPICAAAKGLCPPEDVGGVWGYEELIEGAKSGDTSEEFLETVEWYGFTVEMLKNIENEPVDIDYINKELEKFR